MKRLLNSDGFSAIEVAFVLIVMGLIGGSGYYVYKSQKGVSPKSGSTTLASAKPQFAESDSVAGYLTYDSTKFKQVSTIGLPAVDSSNPDVNTVIVAANVVGYGDSGLYLYDLHTNKTYKLTSGGGDPRIMSDHFVVYGFDEGKGSNHKLGAKLLDLNTGESKIIFSASPETVPGTVCCSVSPDGLKLALPQKDKLTVWDIRSGETRDYPATLDPVVQASTAGALGVEISYATPAWAGNESVIYADKPASKSVTANGETSNVDIDTKLFQINLSDGKSTELTTDNRGIYNIYTREEGGVIFANEGSEFTEQSLDNEPTVLSNNGYAFNSLSPSGDKLYTFTALPNPSVATGYSAIDTKTKVAKSFNPVPSEVTSFSEVIPKGWAGDDKIILEILDTAGRTNHEYIAIYNTTTDKVEQYTTIR